MVEYNSLGRITQLAIVNLGQIEKFTVYGFFAIVALALLTNVVAWWFLRYVWLKVVRTMESLHEKIALGDDLLCGRIVPDEAMFVLCPLAGADFVDNEYEICAKIQRQQEELRQRGVRPKVFEYTPEEVSEFHATKHRLWECSLDSSSESFHVRVERMSKSANARDAGNGAR